MISSDRDFLQKIRTREEEYRNRRLRTIRRLTVAFAGVVVCFAVGATSILITKNGIGMKASSKDESMLENYGGEDKNNAYNAEADGKEEHMPGMDVEDISLENSDSHSAPESATDVTVEDVTDEGQEISASEIYVIVNGSPVLLTGLSDEFIRNVDELLHNALSEEVYLPEYDLQGKEAIGCIIRGAGDKAKKYYIYQDGYVIDDQFFSSNRTDMYELIEILKECQSRF